MDIIQSLNLATAGELALASFLIGIITQAIKKTGKVSTQLMPLVAIVLGVVVGLITVIATKDTNYVSGAVAGGIVGAATSGLVDFGTGTTSIVSDAVSTVKANKATQTVPEAVISKAVADYMASHDTASTTQASSTATSTSTTTSGGESSETK